MWTWIRDEQCKARKWHTCSLCEKLIPPGEKYCRRTGTDEGEIFTTKMHLKCEEYSRECYAGDDEWCHDPAEFRGGMEDYYDDQKSM